MGNTTAIGAYDPSDPTQSAFLAALALGETGQTSQSTFLGVSGTNLQGVTTDQYGFPQWGGVGSGSSASHAAGTFQFQPATWDSLAAQYGLNFSNPSDQDAGAWYLAEQTYASATGGNLEQALQSGDYQSVQSALASVWPSVTGNGAAPQGLAASLASGQGATLPATSSSGSTAGKTGSGAASGGSGIIATIEDFFVRFGLIIVGGVIVIVALWQILSSQGIVPSPSDTAHSAGEALAALAV